MLFKHVSYYQVVRVRCLKKHQKYLKTENLTELLANFEPTEKAYSTRYFFMRNKVIASCMTNVNNETSAKQQ
jgi:hypothetical protein